MVMAFGAVIVVALHYDRVWLEQCYTVARLRLLLIQERARCCLASGDSMTSDRMVLLGMEEDLQAEVCRQLALELSNGGLSKARLARLEPRLVD